MPSSSRPAHLSPEALKRKQREVREGFPPALALRVHRALSWFTRAEEAADDLDVRFILLWIAFNSAYAADIGREGTNGDGADGGAGADRAWSGERRRFRAFFERLVALDKGDRIYNAVWTRFPHEIRVLLDNRYVFAPFWDHQNGVPGCADWEDRFAAGRRAVAAAMAAKDTARLLEIVFDRLYVLRNQIVHGGATWNSSVNRHQVRDGAAVLGWLMPVFIDLMMDHPGEDWGSPFYPVVE
ncbi:hypothetical protein [Alsobacter sp. R-9]